jgi:hypothetical protein
MTGPEIPDSPPFSSDTMKHIAAIVVLAVCATAAQAQLRTIPQDAVRGEIRHVEGSVIEIDGKTWRLAPGAQVRDHFNRVLVPMAIPPGALVKYQTESDDVVSRVWILTPEEAAQPDSDSRPARAR